MCHYKREQKKTKNKQKKQKSKEKKNKNKRSKPLIPVLEEVVKTGQFRL